MTLCGQPIRSSLLRDSPLRINFLRGARVSHGTRMVDPITLPHCTLSLDSRYLTTLWKTQTQLAHVSTTGDRVGYWLDRHLGGAAYDFSIGAGLEPTWSSSGMGAHPGVVGDGVMSFLETSGPISQFVSTSAYEISLAIRTPTTLHGAYNTNAAYYLNPAIFGDVNGYFALGTEGAADGQVDRVGLAHYGTGTPPVQSLAASTNYVLHFRWDNTKVYLSVNGNAEVSSAENAPVTLANIALLFRGNVAYFGGSVGAIHTFNAALSTSDRNDLIATMKGIWL